MHKEGIPFRPIVDYTGSIGHNTSRFLADILTSIIGTTEQFVKNLKQLADDFAILLLLMKVSDRDWNVKAKMLVVLKY